MPNSRAKDKRCVSFWANKDELVRIEKAAESSKITKSELIQLAIKKFLEDEKISNNHRKKEDVKGVGPGKRRKSP